jgi:hypothetical protein
VVHRQICFRTSSERAPCRNFKLMDRTFRLERWERKKKSFCFKLLLFYDFVSCSFASSSSSSFVVLNTLLDFTATFYNCKSLLKRSIFGEHAASGRSAFSQCLSFFCCLGTSAENILIFFQLSFLNSNFKFNFNYILLLFDYYPLNDMHGSIPAHIYMISFLITE